MYRSEDGRAQDNSGNPSPGRKRLRWAAAGIVVLAVAGIAVYRLRHSPFAWGVFLDAFRGVRWSWLTLAIGLIFLSYLGRALRWEVMLRPLRARASLWGLFEINVIGFTAVVLLGRAGELVRPYLIALREKVSFSSQMAAWLLERIFDLLMVLLIFGFALATVPAARLHLGPGLRWVFRTGGWVCAGICLVCLGLLVLFRRYSGSAEERLMGALGFLPAALRERFRKTAAAFAQGMSSTASTSFLFQMLGYSALEWVILIGCYFCLFRAFPATSNFSLGQVTVFMGIVSFGGAVQVPGIGGGFQVAAILVLTEIFGMRLETASGLSILLWVSSYMAVVPVGLLLALREGISWNKIRRIKEELEV